MDKVDMHIHTKFSDGVLSPEAVVDRWKAEGYSTIAITDHDGINGSIRAYEYAKNIGGIEVVPAIEFDSSNEMGSNMHILGYYIDYENDALKETITVLHKWRDERNKQLLRILNESGYDISWDEVAKASGGEFISKPHFAIALVNRAYVESVSEAFEKIFYCHPRMNAFQKKCMNSKDVVRIIQEAGGIAVLAHPMEQMRSDESRADYYPRMIQLLDLFRSYGVDGIECVHPSSTVDDSKIIKDYAEKYNLLTTRGSDFHWDTIERVYR